MGFLFEPPLEYFDRIFGHYAACSPRPAIQLFGGEPTVRDDILTIIARARSHGFSTRLVTNGLRLADEDFCRKIIQSRVTVLLSFDGSDPETYRVVRHSAAALSLKQRALDNIASIGGAKVVVMTLVIKGHNDDEIPSILSLCHERREHVRAVCFVPLAHAWEPAKFDFQPDRATTEDIEDLVDGAFPEERLEFLPAGLLSRLPELLKHLRLKPFLAFGKHPNCESMYLLISNGQRYLPVASYLKHPLSVVAKALMTAERRMSRVGQMVEAALTATPRLKPKLLALSARLLVGVVIARHVLLSRLVKGRGAAKIGHAWRLGRAMLRSRKRRQALAQHANVCGALQVLVLPFEDRATLEADRVQGCLTRSAFVDPDSSRVRDVPMCAFNLYRAEIMRKIAAHYDAAAMVDEPVRGASMESQN